MVSSAREFPALWLKICRRVGAESGASIDRVLAAYNNVVGRGTLQRARDGKDVYLQSVQKLADHVGMSLSMFLEDDASDEAAPPNSPPLPVAMHVVLAALAGLAPGRWQMVRARLDALVGDEADVASAAADVATVLAMPPSDKHTAAA